MGSGDLSLSGYLPGEDDNGLSAIAERLTTAWAQAERTGDDLGVATEVLVVGMLRGVSVQHYRDPSVKPPRIEMRFARIEVAEGPQSDQLRALMADLHDRRQSVQALPGIDADPGLPDPNNVREPDRPRKAGGRKATPPPTVRPFEVVKDPDPGEDER